MVAHNDFHGMSKSITPNVLLNPSLKYLHIMSGITHDYLNA